MEIYDLPLPQAAAAAACRRKALNMKFAQSFSS